MRRADCKKKAIGEDGHMGGEMAGGPMPGPTIHQGEHILSGGFVAHTDRPKSA
jgi:hypothetical protein